MYMLFFKEIQLGSRVDYGIRMESFDHVYVL